MQARYLTSPLAVAAVNSGGAAVNSGVAAAVLYSPMQHVLRGACDDTTITCVKRCQDYRCSGCVTGWPCMA